MSDQKKYKLTVIVGNIGSYVNTGVGPQYRTVHIELTNEQNEQLRVGPKWEEIHHSFIEPVTPPAED